MSLVWWCATHCTCEDANFQTQSHETVCVISRRPLLRYVSVVRSWLPPFANVPTPVCQRCCLRLLALDWLSTLTYRDTCSEDIVLAEPIDWPSENWKRNVQKGAVLHELCKVQYVAYNDRLYCTLDHRATILAVSSMT